MYLAKGEYDKALKAMMADLHPSGINYYWLGATDAARGDRAKAIETMQKAFQAGFSDFAALDNSPYFDALPRDPRFQQLIQRYRR